MDTIARQFDVHRDAVMRHRRNHLSPGLHAMRGEVVEAKGHALIDRIEKQIDRVERVAVAGEKQGSARIVLDATREMRGMLELLGKATGDLRDSPQVSINLLTSPEWVRVRDALFEVLAEHPEVREKVAARLLLLDGSRP